MSGGRSILVVDPDPVRLRVVARALSDTGHRVVESASIAAALAVLEDRTPALILLGMPRDDMVEAAHAIRDAVGSGAIVPILALVECPSVDAIEPLFAAGIDGHIPTPVAHDALLAATLPWLSGDDPEAERRRRLGAMFGRAAFDALLVGLARQIVEALATLGTDGERACAHRIAGLAGTLGFADLSAAWLRLSQGDDTARRRARLTAARALDAIDRECAAAGDQPSARSR